MDRVIFRKFKDGDVIAWLPDNPAAPGRCDSYMHIGQHGEGGYPADTVPATRAEYAPLLKELRSIGYKLRAVSRMPPKLPARYYPLRGLYGPDGVGR